MEKKTIKDSSNAMKLVVLGASVAAVAATAYFFLGPKGKQHQKHAKAWAIKMKGEIVEKLERAREVSEPVYHKIIDTVAGEYTKAREDNREEILKLATELKKQWKTLTDSAKPKA